MQDEKMWLRELKKHYASGKLWIGSLMDVIEPLV